MKVALDLRFGLVVSVCSITIERVEMVQRATGLEGLTELLHALDQDVDDATRIDRISALEQLKGAVSAAQARETAAFVDSQRAARRAAGVQPERVDRGIAAQVALARRVSPHQAGRYVGWCKILTTELPVTNAALWAGRTSEYRAMLVAKESIWLSREDRAELDADLGPRLAELGDKQVQNEAKRIAYRLDPAGYVARLKAEENERHVSLRPASASMVRLSALLPLTQGIACQVSLSRQADSRRAAGDERSRGQVMADTLVERLTGQTTASQVPLSIDLIVTDQALFTTGPHRHEPAILLADGVAPVVIPADLARRAALDPTGNTDVFLRRVYRHPATGELAAMDSVAREFPANQRRFLILRDQHCRTPYCGAPIRHADHVVPADEGGPTQIDNGAGRCQACNHAKQAEHWTDTVQPDGTIATTTPTGHRYRSKVPRPPGSPPRTPVVHLVAKPQILDIIIESWNHAA